jgi:hypothetical protein
MSIAILLFDFWTRIEELWCSVVGGLLMSIALKPEKGQAANNKHEQYPGSFHRGVLSCRKINEVLLGNEVIHPKGPAALPMREISAMEGQKSKIFGGSLGTAEHVRPSQKH